MGFRRPTGEEEDEPAEKRRRSGAVLASLLVLLLGLLAGGVGFLTLTREHMQVGSYLLLGPNVNPTAVLVFSRDPGYITGSPPSLSTTLIPNPSHAPPAPIQSTHVFVPIGKEIVRGRLMVDLRGFRLLGP